MPGNQCAADPWKWFHLGPISRDWARCELCGEYLDRIYETDYPYGSWRYIRHAAVAALDAEDSNIATAEYDLCQLCFKPLDGEQGIHSECAQLENRRADWESEARAALDAEVLPPIHKMGDPGYRFAYTPDAEEAQG